MAENVLERMLEINTRLEKGEVQAKQKANPNRQRVSSQQELDQLIEGYDQAVYGPSAEPVMLPNERKKYSAWEENEHLREIAERGGRAPVDLENKHIPHQILEEIINNPLELKPFTDTNIDKLTQRLDGNMPGIKASMNILEKIDKREQEQKKKINENILPKRSEGESIDYDRLTSIIEEVIDRKLNGLNEAISRKSQPYIPSMKFMNFKDNFYFVDNDNNVFECVMKYKGKQKKKK